ncbi:MAG: TIGR01906 family membrane protein [Anaerolineae bacterium]|nr:TIGR01906 family membrane protein [Anaerolineae bacterium]
MLTRFLMLIVTLLIPPLLCLMAVRVIMSPLFLQIEYTRPGFPDDPYGMTLSERLSLGPRAVNYLIYDESPEFLSTITFPDGALLFNERELIHMRDVQAITRVAFATAAGLGALCIVSLFWLYRRDRARLSAALCRGGVATVSVLAAIVVLVVVAWDRFFVLFHTLFFADGTWYFPTSDTLIRLFPEQFWFDAAIAVGTLTLLGAGALVFLARQLALRSG